MKLVPGQYNFLALPPGQSAPFSYEALQRTGMPIAPYIEHGSWETGQPDLMMYGRDPYRGMMGVPMPKIAGVRLCSDTFNYKAADIPVARVTGHGRRLDRNQGNYSFPGHRYASQPLLGLGTEPGLVQEYLCSDTQVAQACKARSEESMRTSTYVAAGAAVVAGLIGALLKRPLLGAVAGGVVGGLLHMTWSKGYRE